MADEKNENYEPVRETCLSLYERGQFSPLSLLESLMDVPGVPMHDPVHHYIMPCTLLALAAREKKQDITVLEEWLKIAETRARSVLPGFCGWWGCCGSAVGCGIFASIVMNASPKQELHWATINAYTSRCLASIASVGGPRCCKRTSYLSLKAAIHEAPELLGINLGPEPSPVCTWSPYNDDCRKEGCPFYSAEALTVERNLRKVQFAFLSPEATQEGQK